MHITMMIIASAGIHQAQPIGYLYITQDNHSAGEGVSRGLRRASIEMESEMRVHISETKASDTCLCKY